MDMGDMFRAGLERDGYFDTIRGAPQFEEIMNRFVGQMPAGGVRGPAPVMPSMPQVPQMNALPMQGGMVDFNALAGMMAGPMPDLSQFFSSPAPVMSLPFVPSGVKGPQVVEPPGKNPINPVTMPQGLVGEAMGGQPGGLIGRAVAAALADSPSSGLPSAAPQADQGGGLLAQAMNATPGGFDKSAYMRALSGASPFDPITRLGGFSAMLDPRMGGLL